MRGYKIEIAASGRAICKKCEQLIPIGTRKLILSEQGFQFPKKSTFCRNCGIEELNKEEDNLKKKIELLEEDFTHPNPKELKEE